MPNGLTAVRCENGARVRFSGRLRQDTGKAILLEVKVCGARRSIWLPTRKIRRRALGEGTEEITMAIADAWEKGFEIVDPPLVDGANGSGTAENRPAGQPQAFPGSKIAPKV